MQDAGEFDMSDAAAMSSCRWRARGRCAPGGPVKRAHTGTARALKAAIAMLVLGLIAAQPAQTAELRRIKVGVPDVEVFYYQGAVTNGDALRLQSEIAKLAPNKRVAILLNSGGGVYEEGKALGRLFYNAKISTFVLGNGGLCLSSCAMAFLGGRDLVTGEPLRAIIQGGSLGFHQFIKVLPPEQKFTKADLEKAVGEVQRAVFDDLKYLKEINQDPRSYRRNISEPAESMLYIRDSAALENGFHVINAESRTLISPDVFLERIKRK
jgi:hypothetical protein